MTLTRRDFRFELPEDLIAQHPPQRRSEGRLLVLPAAAAPVDARVTDLPDWLRAGDLLVFNDTRVIPARLRGRKDSGGRVEILVERLIDEQTLWAQLGVSKAPRPGTRLILEGQTAEFEVLGREADLFQLRLLAPAMPLLDLLEREGELPLPPYIQHRPDAEDAQRYQTVFAREPGAVAAPTAGLHFDEALFAALEARGVRRATLTLHVGAGTFQPLRVEQLSEHRMHAERYRIDAALCAAVAETRARGGRVVAVGTTVIRALESAAAAGPLQPGAGETRLFITPGYRFQVVDALFTNFHLPESTLLMLVCAFGGHQRLLAAYRHAVAQRYRFFSYGDAMLIEPQADGAG
ncbi:MAG TPA: tRNA preQ1(34) S-adenosylmethionine ribosyltransferase-isomerase QueA [Nevskiaceae bacterium]|nr:tRNA preQ1(34) S-adenosylmethionine ribosyltransferase-isomerase QueA [Nevskiaceae bacterium]